MQGLFVNYWYYFLLIPVLKFLINMNHYLYLRKALKKHTIWEEGLGDDVPIKNRDDSNHAEQWLIAHMHEIKQRILRTGINDPVVASMKLIGYRHVQPVRASALDNLVVLNSELAGLGRQAITRAKGHYKVQALKTLNPIYWLELILFLPREMINYVNPDSKSKGLDTAKNLIQIIYWLVFMTIAIIKMFMVK